MLAHAGRCVCWCALSSSCVKLHEEVFLVEGPSHGNVLLIRFNLQHFLWDADTSDRDARLC